MTASPSTGGAAGGAPRPARRHRGALAVVVVVAVIAALVSGGVAASRKGLLGTAASHLPWASSPPPCPPTRLGVIAAPELVGTVQALVQPLTGRQLPDGSCLRVDVQGEDPSKTVASSPTTALGGLPQLWIPDASLWMGQAPSWSLKPLGSMASSPVVLAATPATVRRLGWAGRDVTWAEGLTADRTLLAPGMTDDASALLGLLALARSLGAGPQTEQTIAGVVLAASRQSVTDRSAALAFVRGNPQLAPVVLTSARVVTQADQDPATNGLVAVRPQGLPAVLDYPILRVTGPDDDVVTDAGVALVVAALRSPAAQAAAKAAGFGPPVPSANPTSALGQAALKAVNDQIAAFVGQVRARATPSRLLTLIDVSLSMRIPVRPGYSRARLAVQAAIGAGKLLPDDSAIGLWTFAGRHGDKSYTELAPIDLLSASDHGTTHRKFVNAKLADLPRHLEGGGTSLYASTLAAIGEMRSSYDRTATNAVVVFTDGANDYAGGIDLQHFISEAKADRAAHPSRPLTLVVIGIGPDADMTSLKAMAGAVNGLAYHADDAQTLRTVVFDAIAKRTRTQG
jgi:Ca-activated chloride channel family protein